MEQTSCFSEEIFEPTSLNKNFICSIGLGVLNNPINTSCGHSFCNDCISRWMSRSSSCPFCRSEISLNSNTRNIALKALIDELKVEEGKEKREGSHILKNNKTI